MWSISAILTAAGVFTDNPDDKGYGARADAKIDAVNEAAWIRVPYPCRFNKTIDCFPFPSFVGLYLVIISEWPPLPP